MSLWLGKLGYNSLHNLHFCCFVLFCFVLFCFVLFCFVLLVGWLCCVVSCRVVFYWVGFCCVVSCRVVSCLVGSARLLAGSSRSRQWRIEFLYRYKRAKTSGITVLNIWKLYLYFVYFKLYLYFECMSPPVPLKNDARATPGKLVY